jgi:hypothetical protein
VLLSGCGGNSENEKGAAGRDGRDTRSNSATPTAASTSDVIIQMTGLLLVVPPGAAGNPVEVYLPSAQGGDHSAILGFAVPTGMTLRDSLCNNSGTMADPREYCYVDLKRWSLQPFGRGGTLATETVAADQPVTPSGVVNATHLSGGRFKAFRQRALARSDASVTFLSGRLGKACKLAQWTYARVNHGTGTVEQQWTDSLANVVNWEMPGVDSAVLVFISRTAPDTATVPLPAGDVFLLLAHIPEGERHRLPPDTTTTVLNSTNVVADFHPLYDLLSTSNAAGDGIPQGAPHRSVPLFKGGRGMACPIMLKSGSRFTEGPRSMATYACMPAIGQGGT